MKHGRMRIVVALFLVWSILAMAGGGTSKPQLSEADVTAIRATVRDIRIAIVSADAKALLGHISQSEGLSCTDTQYSYAEAKAFVQNPRSAFHQSLFDTARFRKECGSGYPAAYPAISEKEFYASANKEVSIEVVNLNWVKVTIRSPVKTHYERWLYLHREGQAWKIGGGSFVIGNCTCG